MAKIARPPGTVGFHDAGIMVWEEPNAGKRRCGLPDGYEEEFRRVILGGLVRLMRQRRWRVSSDPDTDKHYRCLRHNHKWCVHPSGLECSIRLGGRSIEIKFYQNIKKSKNPHRYGNYYEYDRLALMPYLMRKRCEMEMDHLAGWLIFNCDYTFKPDRPQCHAGPGGVDVDTWLEHDWKYNRFERERPDPTSTEHIQPYNRKCMDGMLNNGDHVYFLWSPFRTRWGKGVAEHHINNMWFVKVGTHEIHNVASHHITRKVPECGLRGRHIRAEDRKKRLENLMLKAAAEQRYLDAERMRRALEGGLYL